MTERYSPAEAKLALARSAELQLQRERVTVGMTRDELVRIAVDSGLDVELLEQALAELEASRVEYTVEEQLTKTVVSFELSRHLSDDERVELTHRLGHEYDVHGRWTTLETGKIWRAGGLALTIRRTHAGELVRLEVRRRWPVLAVALVPAASGALALAVEILFAWKSRIELITWAVFLASLSVGWSFILLHRKQGTDSVGQRLVALLERTVRRLPPEASNPPRVQLEGD